MAEEAEADMLPLPVPPNRPGTFASQAAAEAAEAAEAEAEAEVPARRNYR